MQNAGIQKVLDITASQEFIANAKVPNQLKLNKIYYMKDHYSRNT